MRPSTEKLLKLAEELRADGERLLALTVKLVTALNAEADALEVEAATRSPRAVA